MPGGGSRALCGGRDFGGHARRGHQLAPPAGASAFCGHPPAVRIQSHDMATQSIRGVGGHLLGAFAGPLRVKTHEWKSSNMPARPAAPAHGWAAQPPSA